MMKDNIIIGKGTEVFFVAEYDSYLDEYVRLSNNLDYESCLLYIGNNKSKCKIYADISKYQFLQGA